MEVGERIRQARLAVGMTQQALCGEKITRNMLSMIERGVNKPSLETLCYLAEQLGCPVDALLTGDPLDAARTAFGEGAPIPPPEGPRTPEARLLTALWDLHRAEQAVAEEKLPLARSVLEAMDTAFPYWPLLAQRYHILLAKATGAPLELPDQDDILYLRARDALDRGDHHRAGQYLDAAEHREDPQWQTLRGRCRFLAGDHAAAIALLAPLADRSPKELLPLLEESYAALGDHKNAYLCAKKLREL